ncbi:metabotropic glutamate receptor 3-like [Dreissena polymorpha]|uniref:G-protein coupled receptors family 3 profile domain-containing protein n=1 Tax=Dreissena polymorpha TaxID=45954 RepID=A0A9D4GMR6_DREPO|nr:metabotropic glutamate receptor 3-like [Dreissena polymorpha]XP_052285583.1 metabotropic glutamate receptor 3-like [Dreissena polymorpha]KAH3819850.1 hypothetical protein DPMN_121592 [Dreissena polymorpha]
METLTFIILLGTFMQISPLFAIDPFLSSPGSSVVLVFIDLHEGRQGDGGCVGVNWVNFGRAHYMYWRSMQGNITGIEIYDSCGSERRVADILRHRLHRTACNSSGIPAPVSGVVSCSRANVAALVPSLLGTLHVRIHDGDQTPVSDNGLILAEIPSLESVQVLTEILRRLNWTYVSTVTDDTLISQAELKTFLKLADDSGICIGASYTVNDVINNNLHDVHTSGAVVFLQNMLELHSFGGRLQNLVILSHDRAIEDTQIMDSVDKALVLTDNFPEGAINNTKFMDYMLNLTNNELLIENDTDVQYFIKIFNCTYNATEQTAVCLDPDVIKKHLTRAVGTERMHVFGDVYEFMANIAERLESQKCPSFSRDCINADMLDTSPVFAVANNTLLRRSPFSINISYISNGRINQKGVFSTTRDKEVTPDVSYWIASSEPFPQSACTTWCPGCHASLCFKSADNLMFDGEYVYIPGDLVIAAMVPLSAVWNKIGAGNTCSGLRPRDNYDVISEAFLFGVQSYKSRHPSNFRNISIGAILFDTCSDFYRGAQILANFESCKYAFNHSQHWSPTPLKVPVYLSFDFDAHQLPNGAGAIGKLALQMDPLGRIYVKGGLVYDPSMYSYDAVAEFLKAMNWTHIGLLTSQNMTGFSIDFLSDSTKSNNVCIAFHRHLPRASHEISPVVDTITTSSASTVLIFGTSGDIDYFFRSLTSRLVVKTWIIIESRENWVDFTPIPLPYGTILFQRYAKQNAMFNNHLNRLIAGQSVKTTTKNMWISKYAQERSVNRIPSPSVNDVTRMQASDVIRTLDVSLAALQRAVITVCGSNSSLCSIFLPDGPQRTMDELQSVKLNYEGDFVDMHEPSEMSGNYLISSVQESGMIKVGHWVDQQLEVFFHELKSYNSIGEPLKELRPSVCPGRVCSCTNMNMSSDGKNQTLSANLDKDMGFVNTTGEFQRGLWQIITIVIAGSGAFLALILLLYLICKLFGGGLLRRHLVLGIPLLFATMLLLLSVLPFVFSPSEAVCGLRYFAHGLSYALCFGILLTKMMSLRDYKFVGLGGDVSKVNQLLLAFFIAAVQIAIGVQWWVLRSPVLITVNVTELVDGQVRKNTYYACDFTRRDFISYHSYVIFLIVLCCLYSFSIKSSLRNTKEVSSKVLVVCAWFCLALWIAIIVTFFVLTRDFLEAICAIGLLANAMSILLIIFLPTVTLISRLKYDVAKSPGDRNSNGYKLDTDFQFERPYSLPSTLHSAITDKSLTMPRSLATFDTSLSY